MAWLQFPTKKTVAINMPSVTLPPAVAGEPPVAVIFFLSCDNLFITLHTPNGVSRWGKQVFEEKRGEFGAAGQAGFLIN